MNNRQIINLLWLLLSIVFFTLLFSCCSGPGIPGAFELSDNGVIIHLNAKTSTPDNPVTVDFTAGTYIFID